MANATFSPQDFKVWVIEETTTGNANGDSPNAPAITSGLYQLDVDSVSLPTIAPNQVVTPRTRQGRLLHKDDFFQDNEYRATEISLAGTLRKDGGHVMLLQSVTGNSLTPDSIADPDVITGHTGVGFDYGVSAANKTFTLVVESPDVTDGYNTIMPGCLCTNFAISADMGTDGGQYKWSATVSTGKNPYFTNAQTPAGSAYGTGSVALSTLSAIKVASITSPVLSGFSVTIDHPAVYTGTSGTGYQSFARSAEIALSATASVKYDSLTRALPSTFNTQSAADAADSLLLTQTTASDFSIGMDASVLTNVSFNAGDVMMLDVEMKGVSDGSGDALTIDVTA